MEELNKRIIECKTEKDAEEIREEIIISAYDSVY